MKKNKRNNTGIWKAGLAALMVLAVTGCSATTNSSTEIKTTTELQTEAENAEKTYEYHESQMEHDKEESVYVLADAYGTPDEITVTTSLKNPGEQEPITDYTVLSDIKNKEGDEEYKLSSDGTLTWENHGRDIQYEGTTTKDLPVSVKVTYFLDDKEVTAEELAGATGAVRIRFDYINHTAEENSIVPFTVISGMMLKEDVASNVSVSNGKVKMMDGDYLVIGYVVPGVKDVLALDELETFEEDEDDTETAAEESEDENEMFADSIEVSFDAVDFELEFTATFMMNGILAEADTGKLSEQVEDLADGFDSLHSGTRKLSDALKQLDDSGDTLVSGAAQLQSGLESLNQTLSQIPPEVLAQDPAMAQLAATVAALAEGSGQLTEGIAAYTDGVGQVYEGSTKLNNATYELTQTADDLETAVERIQTLKDTDVSYENYGGMEEGKTGSVTFLVETAEIKAEK